MQLIMVADLCLAGFHHICRYRARRRGDVLHLLSSNSVLFQQSVGDWTLSATISISVNHSFVLLATIGLNHTERCADKVLEIRHFYDILVAEFIDWVTNIS